MSRSKAFSPAVTLQQMADVFIERGYAATSLSQLEAACGLGKQSLYNSFGDKKAMYLGAVECATGRAAATAAAMRSAADGRAAIDLLFRQLVEDCASTDESRRSCIVSAGLLEGVADPDIQGRLQGKWQETRTLLLGAVRRGQADGSIASATNSSELADHLMAAISGLRVMARTLTGAARLRRVARHMLSVLDTD